MVAVRTREIGIRKALGASIPAVFVLLTADLVKWEVIGSFLAVPFAYLAMNNWLIQFADRIEMPVWSFVTVALGAIALAILTSGSQTLRAAVSNPVESLRSE